MNLYDLPKFNLPKISKPKFLNDRNFHLLVLIVLVSSIFGFLAGAISGHYFYTGEVNDYLSKLNTIFLKPQAKVEKEYVPQTSQEESVINVVKDFSPAVVSIVITKDVPIMEEYYTNPFQDFGLPLQLQIPQYRQMGTEKQEIGGGTGFIISEEGMILTNKHVVVDTEADYTVFTNDGKSYPAKVLARDSIQDLAIIKIEREKLIGSKGEFSFKNFPIVKLGDSDKIQMGQTVIAVGNALGEFRNTVSVGVVSGLSRTIIASGGGISETIEDVIQTDTAINKGNSGGPLLNLKGEVIGINTAMVEQAQSIGFSIPINKAKRDIEQIKKTGKITYPFLGVRYILVTEKIQKENNLESSWGAWITKGENGEVAVSSGSAADKAGLQENDIILEFNNEKITTDNSLSKIIQKYNPGDKISLKILRGKEEKTIEVVLGERNE